MHFSKRRAGRSDKVEAEAYSIDPSPTALRWLGVFFYPRLSFKEHVTEWSKRALHVANHIRHLNKVVKGSPPDKTAMAAKACVIPKATHAAEA